MSDALRPVLESLLGPLEDPALERLLERVEPHRYPPGFAVFHEGLEPKAMVLLLEGRLRIGKLRPDKRQESIARVSPVALLGIAPVLTGKRHPSTAMALEPSNCLLIPRSLLHPGPDPLERQLAARLMKACLRGMNAQLRAANARLYGLAGENELLAALALDLGAWSLPWEP
jgi:CRP-like cAMP-binding protein